MIERKALGGLALLCALALCAVAAPNASAGFGLTAYTCVANGGANDFSDPHCANHVTPGTGSYGHVLIETWFPTRVEGSNATTKGEGAEPAVINSVIAGVATEIKCASVTGTGEGENQEVSAAVHFWYMFTLKLFSSCTVEKPAGKGCTVKGGQFETNELKGETFGEAPPEAMGLKIKPASGTVLAPITIEGCSVGALNKTLNLEGSMKAELVGATVNTTRTATESEGTLTLAGQKAGLTSKTTYRMYGGGNPIAFTTTS